MTFSSMKSPKSYYSSFYILDNLSTHYNLFFLQVLRLLSWLPLQAMLGWWKCSWTKGVTSRLSQREPKTHPSPWPALEDARR